MPRHLELGAAGEELVVGWYRARGYRLVARNWRVREGEIDVIVRRRRTLVFCEVKTRSSLRYGLPVEAVDDEKQRRIRRLAAIFLRQSRRSTRPRTIRFDVASVTPGGIEVREDAF